MGIHHCSPEICKVHERPKEEAVNKHMRLGNILNHIEIPKELLTFNVVDYIKLDNCNMGRGEASSQAVR